jgi:hypothetical protein
MLGDIFNGIGIGVLLCLVFTIGALLLVPETSDELDPELKETIMDGDRLFREAMHRLDLEVISP